MGLSNWATLALNQDSEPVVGGSFVSDLGFSVDIYKNWIYVLDRAAWQDGGRYVEPTVMELWHGEFWYKDAHIVVRRIVDTMWHPDEDGVLVVAYSNDNCRMLAGCGLPGYTAEGKWVGVQRKHVDALISLFEEEELGCAFNVDWSKALMANQGDLYFAKHAQLDPQVSVVGDPKEPHMTKFIEQIKDRR